MSDTKKGHILYFELNYENSHLRKVLNEKLPHHMMCVSLQYRYNLGFILEVLPVSKFLTVDINCIPVHRQYL